MSSQNFNDLKLSIQKCKKSDSLTSIPQFYNLNVVNDRLALQTLLQSNPSIIVSDNIRSQIKELHKIRNPEQTFTDKQLDEVFDKWETENDPYLYGIWVYYPWNERLVHLVPKEEFIELRTSRNKYKISQEEQDRLSEKVIGVIGLSVGQSVAVTMAIERCFGTLRIADFDVLELTNLNRIRSGVHSLGLQKTIMVCREIMEIDPFLNVEMYQEGITEENIDDFLTANGKIDVLIEECDSLDIKILARIRAREHGIPVIMDTSDRGMIDIERFDLEKNREILHGRVPIDNVNSLKGLSYEDKIPIILEMVGVEQMSKKLKSSMIEISKTLTTWPQLVSEVTLGGSLCTTIARAIMLGRNVQSGRFYIDPSDQFIEKQQEVKDNSKARMPLNYEGVIKKNKVRGIEIEREIREEILRNAALAPSAGNTQPWKVFYKEGAFYVFLDEERSGFFGDYKYQASFLGIGAFLENFEMAANAAGIRMQNDLFPDEDETRFVARLYSTSPIGSLIADPLFKYIGKRHTNRNTFRNKEIPEEFLEEVKALFANYSGYNFHYSADDHARARIGKMVGRADRARILNKDGHEGFYNEIRWSDKEAKNTGDGIDIETVDIKPSEIAGFKIASDWEAIKLLDELDLGNAFIDLSKKTIENSDAILLVSCSQFDNFSLVLGGRIIERLWLICTKHSIAVQPLLSTCLFYNALHFGAEGDLDMRIQNELKLMEAEYLQIFPNLKTNEAQLFLIRLSGVDGKYKQAYRRDIADFYTE